MQRQFVMILLMTTIITAFSAAQPPANGPVALTNYTFTESGLSGVLTTIITPGAGIPELVVSGENANFLSAKGKDIFVRKGFYKELQRRDRLSFAVTLKSKGKVVSKNTFTLLKDRFHRNQVIAHRGAWKDNNTSENSVASLRGAIALGCFGSETDVHMTADSALVINHDPHWGGLPVQKSTLADLRKTKLSNGEQLPLLEDFLKIIKEQTGTRLILELKSSERGKEWGDATVRKVIQTVHKMQAPAWMVYISFDYDMCRELLRLEPSANIQYLNGDKSPSQLKADGIRGADYHYSVFRKHPDWIAQAKELGVDLNAWTVNDVENMQWLLANHFEFITTNEPRVLFEEIQKSPASHGWKLSWSDEFDYNGLPDNAKWNFDTGGDGWGNNERQFYTASDTANAICSDGVLSIVIRKERKGNNDYTSARLTTKNKASWKYGRIEVRAKLPAGLGLWPAIWMLSSRIDEVPWPACGEIDIMEHVGYEPDSSWATVHTGAFNHLKGTQKGTKTFIAHPYDRYHIFAIEWTQDAIVFEVDNKPFFRFDNEHKTRAEWPFDDPFFLILNTAVGGSLGGREGIDEHIFPASFKVDYVRVFQRE